MQPGLRYTVAETLPHGPGFMLLDEVLDYGPEHACCALTVREDSMFYEPGKGVPAWVAIEYLAQTIGVYVGITRLQSGRAVQVGLLLGTRAFECHCDYFRAGQRLHARAERLMHDVSGIGAFACELRDGQKLLARADIKAFQPDNIETYLRTLKEQAA